MKTHKQEFCSISKQRNLEWSIELTGSPRDAATDSSEDEWERNRHPPAPPSHHQPFKSAAVEAGDAKIQDHVAYFSDVLSKAALSPFPDHMPHLSVAGYRKLYEENFGNPRGAHFIVHQHDHPVAGVHYDLRLQINETSSASWAIMYGLPGDPNSQRLMRNATETRVHCLWNHLIETASVHTGSLLIWDTGTYTVLDRTPKHMPAEDPNSQQSSSQESVVSAHPQITEQEKLHRAFQDRKIRIQLHGTRLPQNYVLNLRLTTQEDAAGRAKAERKPKTRRRRRRQPATKGMLAPPPPPMMTSSSDNDSDSSSSSSLEKNIQTTTGRPSKKRRRGVPEADVEEVGDEEGEEDEEEAVVTVPTDETNADSISAMEKELRELEDETVRRTNAYMGATNTINSVHQRRWYLSLDRQACGFVKKRRKGHVLWEQVGTTATGDPDQKQDDDQGQRHEEEEEEEDDDDDDGMRTYRLRFPFYVQGSEVERSVVTGRQGADVLKDEGVVGFVPRKGWRAVLR